MCQQRHWVLTVGRMVQGGILQRLQGGIRPQCVRHVGRSLRLQVVPPEAGSESQIDTSMGHDDHDSRKCVCGGVLEVRERFVDGEGS